MKPFNPEATCPKCGHDEISSNHVPERLCSFMSYSESDREREEHIRRRCQRCHYSWNEATLDREEGK